MPQDKIFDNLRQNWFLIIFFGSLIFSWATFTFKVETLETKLVANELATSKNRELINEQNIEIQTKLNGLEIQLTKIQTTVESLDRTLQGFDITYVP